MTEKDRQLAAAKLAFRLALWYAAAITVLLIVTAVWL